MSSTTPYVGSSAGHHLLFPRPHSLAFSDAANTSNNNSSSNSNSISVSSSIGSSNRNSNNSTNSNINKYALVVGAGTPASLAGGVGVGNASTIVAGDVFLDDQEDQIVPDCSVMAPGKLGDLSPLNETSTWLHYNNLNHHHHHQHNHNHNHSHNHNHNHNHNHHAMSSAETPTSQCHQTSGFLSTAVHLSLQEVTTLAHFFFPRTAFLYQR